METAFRKEVQEGRQRWALPQKKRTVVKGPASLQVDAHGGLVLLGRTVVLSYCRTVVLSYCCCQVRGREGSRLASGLFIKRSHSAPPPWRGGEGERASETSGPVGGEAPMRQTNRAQWRRTTTRRRRSSHNRTTATAAQCGFSSLLWLLLLSRPIPLGGQTGETGETRAWLSEVLKGWNAGGREGVEGRSAVRCAVCSGRRRGDDGDEGRQKGRKQ